jgi:hypothetical protein
VSNPEHVLRVNVPDFLNQDFGDSVVLHHSQISTPIEDEFTLVDEQENSRIQQGVYSIVIDAAILISGAGSGLVMKFKQYLAVKSVSLEYVLENIDHGIDSVCSRQDAFDDKKSLILKRLFIMDGHSILFEVPFERSSDGAQNGVRGQFVFKVDQAKVVDADLSHIETLSKLVPGVNGRDLRGQILESSLGL